MQVSNHRRLFALAMAVGLAAGACSGSAASPTSAPAASSAATPAAQSVAPASAAPASAAASAGAVQFPTPEKTSVKIALSVVSEPSQYAEKLAQQLGLYQKYGLTVDVVGFEGDGKSVQALMAGQVDYMVVGVSSVINTLTTDTPTKAISMNSILVNDALFCRADIKTAADAKGKIFAVSTFGGTSHGSVLMALNALGLKPSDVTITQVGGQSERIAALKGGSIGCAPADASLQPELEKLGFNMLVNLAASGQTWGRSGLATKVDTLKSMPNTTLAVQAAILEAQNSIWLDTPTAISKFMEFTTQTQDQATTAINSFLKTGDRTMMFDQKAFQAPAQTLAAVQPAIANVDLTQAYDLSFLQKLADMGFYKQINDPLP